MATLEQEEAPVVVIAPDHDIAPSDDEEDNHKRRRSKFDSEREEEELQYVPDQNPPDRAKRFKPDTNNTGSAFEDMLKKHILAKKENTKVSINSHNKMTCNRKPTSNNNRHNNNTKYDPRNRRILQQQQRQKQQQQQQQQPQHHISLELYHKEFSDVDSSSISVDALTNKISTFLDENNKTLIEVMISHLGAAHSLDFVRMTAEKEDEGGIVTVSRPPRRRTPGGVLFYLLKELTAPDVRKAIFTDERVKVSKQQNKEKAKQE